MWVPPEKSGSFSGMLQNTHNHHHNHGSCQQKCPPKKCVLNYNRLFELECSRLTHMRPQAPQWCIVQMGDNPPCKRAYCFGEWKGRMALKGLLCSGDDASQQHWSVLRAIHPFNLQKKYSLARGVFSHWVMRTARGARPHMGCKGVISSGVGHGWLWLRWTLLAVGGWWCHIFLILRRINTILTPDPANQ